MEVSRQAHSAQRHAHPNLTGTIYHLLSRLKRNGPSVSTYASTRRLALGPSTSEIYLQSDPNGGVSPGPPDRQISLAARSVPVSLRLLGHGQNSWPCAVSRRSMPAAAAGRVRPSGEPGGRLGPPSRVGGRETPSFAPSCQRASAQGGSSRAGRLRRPCHRDAGTGSGRRRDTQAGMGIPGPGPCRAVRLVGLAREGGRWTAGGAAKAQLAWQPSAILQPQRARCRRPIWPP